MVEEASLEFRLRKIDETRTYLLNEIKQNDLMSEKCKKTYKYFCKKLCWALAYSSFNTHWLCSISAFALLVCVPVGIASSVVEIKISAIIVGIKKYKSVIKKKKKHDKILLLGKDMLNTIEVLISKALINSDISCDEFASVNVSREYNQMKKEIKNSETSVEYTIQKQWKGIALVVKNMLLTKIRVFEKLKKIG